MHNEANHRVSILQLRFGLYRLLYLVQQFCEALRALVLKELVPFRVELLVTALVVLDEHLVDAGTELFLQRGTGVERLQRRVAVAAHKIVANHRFAHGIVRQAGVAGDAPQEEVVLLITTADVRVIIRPQSPVLEAAEHVDARAPGAVLVNVGVDATLVLIVGGLEVLW